MTINDTATFKVSSGPASAEDLLMRWCTVRLVECEKWLSRHGFMGRPIPPLTGARRAFDDRERFARALRADIDDFIARRRDLVPAETADAWELAELVA